MVHQIFCTGLWRRGAVQLPDSAHPYTRRPTKIILAGGVKVTRAEYDNLKGLGLDVTLPPKTPAAAAGGGAA